MEWKVSATINWNYIATLLTIGGIGLAVYFDQIRSQKEFWEDRASLLEKETDSAWHNKYNAMNDFHEGQREKLKIECQYKIDSLIASAEKKSDAQFTPEQVRKLHGILDECEKIKELSKIDSAQIEDLQEVARLSEEIICYQSENIEDQHKIIQLLKKENSLIVSQYEKSSPNTVRLLLIIVGILIICVLAITFRLRKI